jgi:choline dehydrogenase-like flavoprotein
MGGEAMIEKSYDVVIVGSGAGGGTVAKELVPLVRDGKKVLLLEQGPRISADECNGREIEMAPAIYEDEGGFLTVQGTMTLAFGRAYGGSTLVYTGTSMQPPERVIRSWDIPGISHADLDARARKYAAENNVHFLEDHLLNENNKLFVAGCEKAGYKAEQFPINVKGCKGSTLCNLGCPNNAKQGTHAVQLPEAERGGVEIVTRASVQRIEDHAVVARVSEKPHGAKGAPSEWAPGEYRIRAGVVVLAGGAVGSPALLLRSGLTGLPARVGEGFTCHPAHILVGEHEREITNDVGHPKSFFLDRAVEEGFVLETCMYFPFTTAKNMSGFGEPHSKLMRAYPRLQMILVLACDKAVPGNRVGVDRDGKPVVHYTFTDETISAMVRATRASAKIFFGAGALRVHAPSANPPLIERADAGRVDELIRERHFMPGRISVSAAHLMGGCGMGRDAATAVTDGAGRIHGYPWLRVADASLFPDSLEINPYLTIMALADRVAEEIRIDAGTLLAGAR